MRVLSPLRYPGGKASLAPFLTDVLDLNDLRGCEYYEPYAGGTGAALALLEDSIVSRIHINDADWRIYAFWKTLLDDSAGFIEKIMRAELTLEEWKRQRDVCLAPAGHSIEDVGFASFYMNRCNRSGVLNGGPIGGLSQSGEWRLDVRFTKPTLVARAIEITRLRDRICVSNLDAIEFLKTFLPRGVARRNAFVYLDPPYVVKGQRLYMNAYEPGDHRDIARYMRGQSTLPWLMSYDDTPLIRELYSDQQTAFLPIIYSLQDKKSTNELVVAPHRIRLPRTVRIGARRSDLREINARKVA